MNKELYTKELYENTIRTQLDMINELSNKIDNLQEENKRLKDSLETMTFTAKIKQEAVDSLIKTMDKAIELIDEPIYYATDKIETPKIFIRRLKEVKDILQGEENE